MLKKIIKNKKAQNTAEYAICFSFVVAGLIAMQTYAQRGLQGQIRDATIFLKNATSNLGDTLQYEPYYLESDYQVSRDETETQLLDTTVTREELDSTRTRATDGFQRSNYDPTAVGSESPLGTGRLVTGL